MRYLVALMLGVVLWATPTPVKAAWNYVYYRDGFYTRTDGFTNDGWYYRAVPNSSYCYSNGCYSYCAPTYTYYQAAQIPGTAATTYGQAVSTINYSKTWKEDLVGALSANKDTELYLQALRESGLHPAGGGAGPLSYGSGPQYSPGYQTSGYSVYNQGFAQTGSTVYGNAGYSSGLYSVDVNALLDKQARLVERQGELQAVAHNNYAANVNSAREASSDAQKMQIAGSLYIETMRAAQAPKSQATGWSTTPIQPQVAPPVAQPAQPAPPNTTPGNPPPNPEASGSILNQNPMGPHVLIVLADTTIRAKCAECHSANKPKKDLDLTAWKNWNWDQTRRTAFYVKLKDKLSRNDDQRMPPPGHPDVTNEERDALLAVMKPPEG